MNLLEETGILEWGNKEKGDRRAEGQGSIPGVMESWVRSTTQEPQQVQLGHGQVAVLPRLCPHGHWEGLVATG